MAELRILEKSEQLGNPYSHQYIYDLRSKSNWYSLVRRNPGGLLIVDSVFKIKRHDVVLLDTGKRDAVLQVVGVRQVLKRAGRGEMGRYELRTQRNQLSRTLAWVYQTKGIRL